jgi:hypothetical protein
MANFGFSKPAWLCPPRSQRRDLGLRRVARAPLVVLALEEIPPTDEDLSVGVAVLEHPQITAERAPI